MDLVVRVFVKRAPDITKIYLLPLPDSGNGLILSVATLFRGYPVWCTFMKFFPYCIVDTLLQSSLHHLVKSPGRPLPIFWLHPDDQNFLHHDIVLEFMFFSILGPKLHKCLSIVYRFPVK